LVVAGGTTAAGTSYDYGYGRPAQSTATAYDGSKTYYQQPAVAATASGTYSGAETHYQGTADVYIFVISLSMMLPLAL